MSTILEHGVTYFVNKGVRCPECDSSKFRVEKITRETSQYPADGVYVLECTCGCKWQESCG